MVPYDILSIMSSRGSQCGEEEKYLLDENQSGAPNSSGTCKWLCQTGGEEIKLVIMSTEPIKLYKYAIKSANDCPNRDPGSWNLVASDEAGNEIMLHNKEPSSSSTWSDRW